MWPPRLGSVETARDLSHRRLKVSPKSSHAVMIVQLADHAADHYVSYKALSEALWMLR